MKKAVQLPRPKFLAQNISTKVSDSRHFLNLCHTFSAINGNALCLVWFRCIFPIIFGFEILRLYIFHNLMWYVWFHTSICIPKLPHMKRVIMVTKFPQSLKIFMSGLREVIYKKMKVCILSKVFQNKMKFFHDHQIKQFTKMDDLP